jgi:hypothetical protein
MAGRKFDAAVLLGARLAPDMLPLTWQTRVRVRTAAVRRQRKHEPLRARLTRNNDFLMSVPKRFPTCFFTYSSRTTSCVTTAWISASATFSTAGATGRHMTNGGNCCRLLRTEREGNHGADARALPL